MLNKFLSNAGANVFSGVVTAAYQLGLTAIAAHTWQGRQFSVWALALSIASITALFGTNLANVVTRRVVKVRHSIDTQSESSIIAAASRLENQLGALALICLTAAGLYINSRSTNAQADPQYFLGVLFLLIFGNIWIVLTQVKFGLYYSNEKNWPPAIILASARIGAMAGMYLATRYGNESIIQAAAGIAVGAWLGRGLSGQLLAPPHHLKIDNESRPTVKDEYFKNIKIFSGFAIWSIGALVIQYGIPPVISVIAPNKFNAFYLASTLNMIAIGAISAAMSALLAPLSRWHARGDQSPLHRMILIGPAFCSISCVVVLTFAWFALQPLLTLWSSRAANIDDIYPFLALLGFQTIIRTAALGYSVSLAATATTRQMSGAIIVEVLISLCIAAPLGRAYGPNFLLYGLILAGLASSIYTCLIGLSLDSTCTISKKKGTGILLASQAFACLLWFTVNHQSL